MSNTQFQNATERFSNIINVPIPHSNSFDRDKFIEEQCRWDNERIGTLTGYNCSKCRNKGKIHKVVGGIIVASNCECLKIRKSLLLIEKSGLKDKLDKMTFDAFNISTSWQQKMLEKAHQFVLQREYICFFVGGQSGSGKTHICTAIVKALLGQDIPTRYFIWETEIKKALALSGNDDRLAKEKIVAPLMDYTAIYLDDFLRKAKPSQAELSAAFDIINCRYNKRLITVISSEHYLDEICVLDEAIGGRIKEMCGDEYCLSVSRGSDRNYRLKHNQSK